MPSTFVDGPHKKAVENRSGIVGGVGRTDTAVRVIDAPLTRVFAALVDPKALVEWLPPSGMTGRSDHFDGRAGGSYRMTLTYADAPPSGGKSGADGGTRVDMRADDVPPGISAKDHEAGMNSSLDNLEAYLTDPQNDRD